MDIVIEVVLSQDFLPQHHVGAIEEQRKSEESAGVFDDAEGRHDAADGRDERQKPSVLLVGREVADTVNHGYGEEGDRSIQRPAEQLNAFRITDAQQGFHLFQETEEERGVLHIAVGTEAWNEYDHNDSYRNGNQQQRGEGVVLLEVFESL